MHLQSKLLPASRYSAVRINPIPDTSVILSINAWVMDPHITETVHCNSMDWPNLKPLHHRIYSGLVEAKRITPWHFMCNRSPDNNNESNRALVCMSYNTSADAQIFIFMATLCKNKYDAFVLKKERKKLLWKDFRTK